MQCPGFYGMGALLCIDLSVVRERLASHMSLLHVAFLATVYVQAILLIK